MDMRDQIIASAQKLVQQRGFNGFSYADVAGEVGIRKASLHHHFPTKTDLGLAVIETYLAALEKGLAVIDAKALRADNKLRAYVALYRAALSENRLCLCGVLASEVLTLDQAMVPQINRFFNRNIDWLTEVLSAGKSQDALTYTGSAADNARAILSGLQGALLLARASGDASTFDRTASLLVAGFAQRR